MAALASSIPQRTTTTLLERAATIARSYPVDVLDLLEEYSFTPRQIALLRIRFLTFNGDEIDDSDSAKHNDIVTKASEWMDSGMNNDSRPDWKAAGLSSVVVALLQNAVSTFFTSLTTSPRTTNDERLSEASSVPVISHDATRSWLFRLLAFVYRMVSVDPILAEEIGLLGAHPMLIRLMQHDEQQASEVAPAGTAPNNKIYQLDMEELQDVAGNIAACSRPFFPILLLQTNTTGTLRDWQARLPLVFKFHHGDKGHTENTLLGLFSNAEAGRLPAYIVDVPVTEFSHATILIHQVTARQSAQSDVGFGSYCNNIPFQIARKPECCSMTISHSNLSTAFSNLFSY